MARDDMTARFRLDVQGHVREPAVRSIGELADDARLLARAANVGGHNTVRIEPGENRHVGYVVAGGERVGTVTALDAVGSALLEALR